MIPEAAVEAAKEIDAPSQERKQPVFNSPEYWAQLQDRAGRGGNERS